ncbi:RING-H2 finger protein ATL5 [Hondaea fermentalgiana]|uniref:RING-H2 finger protein ATL5 n=1 Tax=Hondaea fermentalgiana TaxID=2315210 RepID=A0A2R5GK40_9STRA|nr:RING-H2 finger protein ATL5 [Hondaea fermentalgiana]|eukprot:GBG30995.1 RING-H2 finger protein ATL5 [Hondaea fermentalgiana]
MSPHGNVREEILILNGLMFTLLLWLKLDYEDKIGAWLCWALVFVPLWVNNCLGIYASLTRLQGLQKQMGELHFACWPQTFKNVALLVVESAVEDFLSVILKIVLIVGPKVPYIVQFAPLWLSAGINLVLFYQRKPHIGVPVKPRFLFAALVVSKLDNLNSLSWPLVCVLASIGLAEMAMYLERRPAAAFEHVAITMFVAQLVTLMGAMGFKRQIHKYHAALHDRRQARAEAGREAREDQKVDVVLDFIADPEDTFVRESSNLFRRLHSNANGSGSGVARAAVAPQAPHSETLAECIVCCEEDGADLILLDCGHGTFCEVCCTELVRRGACPLCRGPIAKVARLKPHTADAESASRTFSASIADVEACVSAASAKAESRESAAATALATS